MPKETVYLVKKEMYFQLSNSVTKMINALRITKDAYQKYLDWYKLDGDVLEDYIDSQYENKISSSIKKYNKGFKKALEIGNSVKKGLLEVKKECDKMEKYYIPTLTIGYITKKFSSKRIKAFKTVNENIEEYFGNFDTAKIELEAKDGMQDAIDLLEIVQLIRNNAVSANITINKAFDALSIDLEVAIRNAITIGEDENEGDTEG